MNPLETKIKLNYKTEKLIKKSMGKSLGRDIALGRKSVKILEKNYKENNERTT